MEFIAFAILILVPQSRKSSRGWGDLPVETPLFWAVPFGELQARGVSASLIYGAGLGAGNAPNSFTTFKSTYGW